MTYAGNQLRKQFTGRLGINVIIVKACELILKHCICISKCLHQLIISRISTGITKRNDTVITSKQNVQTKKISRGGELHDYHLISTEERMFCWGCHQTLIHWCMRKQFLPTLFVRNRGSSMQSGSILQQTTLLFNIKNVTVKRNTKWETLTCIHVLCSNIYHFPVLRYAFVEGQRHSWNKDVSHQNEG